jgi:hypothetical protein
VVSDKPDSAMRRAIAAMVNGEKTFAQIHVGLYDQGIEVSESGLMKALREMVRTGRLVKVRPTIWGPAS